MALTAREVETAEKRLAPYKLGDRDGLYLYVAPTGTKSWRANYTVADPGAGKRRQKTRTYGTWPAVTLAQARELHKAARGEPAAAPQAEPPKPSFEAMAKLWLKKHLPGLSNPKHRVQVENTLAVYAYPKLGALPIDQIPRTLLVDIVQAVQRAPDARGDDRVETAHRVAGRVTAVFDYALDTGIITSHPAARLTRVLQARDVKEPMACIPKEEAGELMREIERYPELVTRLGLKLVAYAFPRVNELLGFKRGELREDGAIWVVPPERVKGKKGKKLPHVIPLSRQARAIVKQLLEMSGCDLVLESPAAPGKQLSENTLLFALYRLGYKGRMTVHGFRSLASTVLNEESHFQADVIERQLAHQETDEVRAAYNRAEYLTQRRVLMQWWADWLDAARAAAPTGP